VAVIVRELAPDVSVGFRDMEPGDRKFILSSWLRNHRKAGDWPRRMANLLGEQAYYDAHTPVVEKLLERSGALVACNPLTPHQIIGYSVMSDSVLHWLFVKAPFRWDPAAEVHPRIGTALLDQMGCAGMRYIPCSHWTKNASSAAAHMRLTYRPFALEDL
jgi:hypothetical protein